METKTVRCTKDVEFLGRIYAKKGEMIEIVSVGSQMGFTGSNGYFFSLPVSSAIQHFDKQEIENLFK